MRAWSRTCHPHPQDFPQLALEHGLALARTISRIEEQHVGVGGKFLALAGQHVPHPIAYEVPRDAPVRQRQHAHRAQLRHGVGIDGQDIHDFGRCAAKLICTGWAGRNRQGNSSRHADFQDERECDGIVAGIDEAGRGPLAGPVMAAAVIVRDLSHAASAGAHDRRFQEADARRSARRSRRLHDCASVTISIGMASVEEIDRINILQATFLAMQPRARGAARRVPNIVLVDGNRVPKQLGCAVRTVIGGDALSLSIAAASIVAKVTRDRLMRELATTIPHYGWERNVGYGTPEHLAAPSPVRAHASTTG